MSDFAKRPLLAGAPAPSQDTEKMLLERLQNSTTEDDHFRWLLFVVGYYRGMQRIDAAKGLLQQFLRESDKSEYKVHCHLALGQIATDEQDLETALNHFGAALALKPATKKVEYVLLNNTGYCLNTLGRYGEGERHCRKALEIDWMRPSAYRNLGVSLHGLGGSRESRCVGRASPCFTREVALAKPRSGGLQSLDYGRPQPFKREEYGDCLRLKYNLTAWFTSD